jgi:hypothetical protein
VNRKGADCAEKNRPTFIFFFFLCGFFIHGFCKVPIMVAGRCPETTRFLQKAMQKRLEGYLESLHSVQRRQSLPGAQGRSHCKFYVCTICTHQRLKKVDKTLNYRTPDE